MTELTDFPEEEQKLITELLNADKSSPEFETRKWDLYNGISSDGLEYVKEHLFDNVFKKLETDLNNLADVYDNEQKEKQKLIQQKIDESNKIWIYTLIGSLFMFYIVVFYFTRVII